MQRVYRSYVILSEAFEAEIRDIPKWNFLSYESDGDKIAKVTPHMFIIKLYIIKFPGKAALVTEAKGD